jgi:hypothetical protein
MTHDELTRKVLDRLRRGPIHFEDILLEFPEEPYRDLLLSWGQLREEGFLGRELETGRYVAVANETKTEGD